MTVSESPRSDGAGITRVGIPRPTVLCVLALLVALGAQSAAAAPIHPFLEAASFDGSTTPSGELDKACGVAVDDEGDVYVANSANSSIDVFGPAGGYLTSIPDAGGPCDLAVDSSGNVYAVDTVTQDVVERAPQGGVYPPTAGLAYEAPLTFDSSGEASGVAVNLANDRVYVATPEQVNVYQPNGSLFQQNEIQRYRTIADGGTYTLSLDSETTAPIPAAASLAQVKSALEGLASVGPGDVNVTGFPPSEGNALYTIAFENGLASTDVPLLKIDASGLTFSKGEVSIERPSTTQPGFDGQIGEGVLDAAYAVGVWGAGGQVYVSEEADASVYVFDATGSRPPVAIDGSGSPDGPFGTLPEANIAVDQSNGHVLVSDIAAGGAVHEFEASGPYLSTIEHEPPFEDAGPSDVAVDPSEGATAGRIYVTSGAGPAGQALAFAPLPDPTHPALAGLDPDPQETLAKKFESPCGVAVDSQGDLYVTNSGTSAIDIFRPQGKGFAYVTSIADLNDPCGAVVDSKGNLFVSHPTEVEPAHHNVLRYTPNAYPFAGTPTYGAPVVVDPGDESFGNGLAINPANQHLLVTHRNSIFEYDSAGNGSALLRTDIGAAILVGTGGVDVYAKTGNLYVVNNKPAAQGVYVIDPTTNEVLTIVNGTNAVSKKPDGGFGGSLNTSQISVDQTDGHVYLSSLKGDVYEFEESGAYVSRFNRNSPSSGSPGIAVDNSGGARARDIFVASGISGTPSVKAYKGPAQYGTPPEAQATGLSGADGTVATLEGTVNPGNAALTDCRFEYVADADFGVDGFAKATKATCAESIAEIGSGGDPVPVHAEIGGLTPTSRYHYRLAAVNSFGTGLSDPRLFGQPAVVPKPPSSVLYTEATLQADVDPSGLPTTYFFEYGLSEAYGQSSAKATVGGEAPQTIERDLFGLQQQATYHFRVVATNSIASVAGPDQILTTLAEPGAGSCPNEALRTGFSAGLPDCRAYELVSPPDAGGRSPADLRAIANLFPSPMASPDGNSLLYHTEGALPGTVGNGVTDGYIARRGASGWTSGGVAPSGAQAVSPRAGGITPEHDYAFWYSGGSGGSLDVAGASANYLRKPNGNFELIGQGPAGVDPTAEGRWIAAGGNHVIFTSSAQLTTDAPAAGTAAIYDRSAAGVAGLVSLLPGELTPAEGEDASYQGASADGSSVAFKIGSTLYLRRGGATFEVDEGDLTYAGLSADGTKLFYVSLPGPRPATSVQRGEILVFDTASATSSPVGSGGESVVVNVSPDGSHVYFASRQQLDGGNGAPGAENLYVWDGSAARFVGTADSEDIESAGDNEAQRLGVWTRATGPEPEGIGWASARSRTDADGSTLVFESLASLTSFDSEGHGEIYRYDADLDQLDCVSCPDGPATADATLQSTRLEVRDSPAHVETKIANVTDDGSAVFFQTPEGLVAGDQNGAQDVYEWRGGEVSLISAGVGKPPSYLYSMSSDGRDVFIATPIGLLPSDLDNGARSIYDAREGGGFPAAAPQLPCSGEECRSGLSGPPNLTGPASEGLQSGNVPSGRRCRKRQRAVKRRGKVRCVARKQHRRRGGNKRPARARAEGGSR